jgi:acetyl esterase
MAARDQAYPATDWSETRANYPSVARNGHNPGLSLGEWRTAHRMSVPPTLDADSVSPVKFANLTEVPPDADRRR